MTTQHRAAGSSEYQAQRLASPSQWVELYGDILYRYASKYFRNQSLVEDLIQDTFVAALSSASQFEGRSSAQTWLIGILRHKILDQLRKKTQAQAFEDDRYEETAFGALFDNLDQWANYEQMTPWNVYPESTLQQKQFLEVLEECSDKLPDRLRQVFLLREMDEFSQKEIGNELGLTSTNVGVTLHRARLLVRECLEKNWVCKTEQASTL